MDSPPAPSLKDQQDAREVLKSFHPKKALGCNSFPIAQKKPPPLPTAWLHFSSDDAVASGGRAGSAAETRPPGFSGISSDPRPGLAVIYELARISPWSYLPLPAFYCCADTDSAIELFWAP